MTKKVIHVLGKMDAGGVETWLVNLLKNTDPTQIQHEFLLQKSGKGFYDDEVLQAGGKIHYCLNNGNPFIYALNLFKVLKKLRPDIVHSHVYTFSGFIVLISFLARIKNRVVHSHTDKKINAIYLFLMRILINLFANKKIAVSKSAGIALFGNLEKVFVLPCGVDIQKYNSCNINENMRMHFKMPSEAIILGHVGRFFEAKNHNFIIDIFNELYVKNNIYHLVLIGDGELKGKVIERVKKLKLESNVHFLGLRKDANTFMNGCFDIFLFPSLWEGLGLVAVEAQIAGLHCIASNMVPKEVDLGNIEFLALDKKQWIKSIKAKKNDSYPSSYNGFDIVSNLSSLIEIYGLD